MLQKFWSINTAAVVERVWNTATNTSNNCPHSRQIRSWWNCQRCSQGMIRLNTNSYKSGVQCCGVGTFHPINAKISKPGITWQWGEPVKCKTMCRFTVPLSLNCASSVHTNFPANSSSSLTMCWNPSQYSSLRSGLSSFISCSSLGMYTFHFARFRMHLTLDRLTPLSWDPWFTEFCGDRTKFLQHRSTGRQTCSSSCSTGSSLVNTFNSSVSLSWMQTISSTYWWQCSELSLTLLLYLLYVFILPIPLQQSLAFNKR